MGSSTWGRALKKEMAAEVAALEWFLCICCMHSCISLNPLWNILWPSMTPKNPPYDYDHLWPQKMTTSETVTKISQNRLATKKWVYGYAGIV
jgi:hypothetical protein